MYHVATLCSTPLPIRHLGMRTHQGTLLITPYYMTYTSFPYHNNKKDICKFGASHISLVQQPSNYNLHLIAEDP